MLWLNSTLRVREARNSAKFFQRLLYILEKEKVEADKKVLVELINKHFPDWRRVL